RPALPGEPMGVDLVELPVLTALEAAGLTVVDGQQVFLDARRIKTPDEITLLTTAATLVDAAYDELYRFLRPGVRENECVGLVAKVLYDLGSEPVEGGNASAGERGSPHPTLYPSRVRPPPPSPPTPSCARATPPSSTSCTATTATGPATTAASRSAARRRPCATPTSAAATTWTRRSPWSSRGRPPPTSSRCGPGQRSSASPTRRRPSPSSTGTGSACPSGRSRSSAGWSPWATPRCWRRACCSPSRPTGRPRTAGRPPGSRTRGWSPA